MISAELLRQSRIETVAHSLREDIGDGDITAQLIAVDTRASGRVITREHAVIAGREWVAEVFRQVDREVILDWQVEDGQHVEPGQLLFRMNGLARSLLSAERAALNWLQTLSAVATQAARYAALISHTRTQLLDTRKTLPGLRLAQKYAITCGGCRNHRLGLWDAFLIKENHIAACGSIAAAVHAARKLAPGKPVEVETENLNELQQALDAGADIIMLDEFSLADMRTAVAQTAGKARLEASGGIDDSTLVAIAETGVDFISLGTLTKNLRAVDLSMRLDA
ncbi:MULTISPECIES: carboxylating nicotinate-nucleotide diphosphorylase [unclassified Marinobacter]|uniref:carboxylating nicotinate-nucleotide diphosphorylase n=1 Tax=unclassified Marinobacter TaxID=83889 RepID=UPI000BF927E4|nr:MULTISPECIES: carboxylating nicotinate-nucleotide diphosphorylase [unclassified Marinobacter]PFG08131.1 nicotinate-nucleotide pyrophosphorylase [carboxylating] [Marinobacter sp. LV10MA510-1]PFG53949.1 nicotinate-nucleotide pyrophosphorylase [carboxylating] [Marinobacter sp. LV10R520-4]